MKQKYTIGEMSDLLGVTTHMLRHYEKMNIIRPEVNAENGYRFYSVIDTRRFNLSRELLGCGISLEQCAQIMSDMPTEEMLRLFDQAIAEKKRQIERSRGAIRVLEKIKETYPRLTERVNQLWVENLPPMWRLNLSQNEQADELSPQIAAQRDEWLACLPVAYWASALRHEALQQYPGGRVQYQYGLMCAEADAVAMGLRKTKEVEIVPGGDYLVTIHQKSTREGFEWQNMDAVMGFLRQKSISFYGDAFSHIIASRMENGGQMTNYHRVFLKIYS